VLTAADILADILNFPLEHFGVDVSTIFSAPLLVAQF
jgi:hypothetical protein